jgi:limonene-1,2-epoxide hydrolase
MAMAHDALHVARAYNEAINAKDWDRVRTILAPDVTSTSHSANHTSHGSEEIIAALKKTTGLVQDTRLEIVNAIGGSDQAVLELRLRGLAHGDPNTGEAGDSGAAPNRVYLPTCHVYQVQDGRIASYSTYSNRTWRPEEGPE